jgi:hypothetical protein
MRSTHAIAVLQRGRGKERERIGVGEGSQKAIDLVKRPLSVSTSVVLHMLPLPAEPADVKSPATTACAHDMPLELDANLRSSRTLDANLPAASEHALDRRRQAGSAEADAEAPQAR